MGIKFYCPNGHKLNVKAFLAGKTGICPQCNAKVTIPFESQIPGKGGPAVSGILATTSAQPADDNGNAPHNPAPLAHSFARQQEHSAAPPGAVQPAAAMSGPASGPTVGHQPPVAAHAGHGNAVATAKPVQAAPVTPGHPVTPGYPGAPAGPAMPDPLSEAPSAVWYVRPPTGGQFGPASADVMRRWLTEGRVTGPSFVWREGWADWRQASAVFPSLSGAAPSGVAAPGHALPGGNGSFASSAPVSSRRASRFRRKNNKALAITAVVVLALLTVVALVALIWVLRN